MESRGISNLWIVKNSGKGDFKSIFFGAFPSMKMNRFIDFDGLIKESKKMKYPFSIVNADRAGTEGIRRWEILDSYQKTELFFFDTFRGVLGLEHFVV